jgi:DNA-binding FadR family transcriptional regulator
MGTGRSAVGEPLGRNLTFGMLDSLGSAIVAGAYDPEAFPTEAGLSRQYNVSRSVTRLAVKMLSAKGLLSARPRQGVAMQPTARWNKFDPDVLRWMLSPGTSVELLIQFDQLRLAIEPEAASLAASRADRRDSRLLADALSRIEAAVDVQATVEAHVDFHVTVLRASGNLMFAQFQDHIRTALHSPARLASGFAPAIANIRNYIAVSDAIARRDPVAARTHMRQVVSDSVNALMHISAPRS